MAIHVALNHRTRYSYDRLISLGPQVVRLRPAPHTRARVLSYSMRITPGGHFINWQQDPQSNYQARLVFPNPTREFGVEVDLVIEMAVLNPFDFFVEPAAQRFPFTYDDALDHELSPFLLKLPAQDRFAAYVNLLQKELLPALPARAPNNPSERPTDVHSHGVYPEPGHTEPPTTPGADSRPLTIDFLVAINRRLWKDIKYLIRLEPGVQAPEETLEKNSGSCRDSAWLLVQLLRHFGLAARFVSGYLIQLAPDQRSLDGPSGPEQDFTDLHAWCEVYLPGAGWIGLDPTSGLLAGEGHVPLAATPDPQSAAPISGCLDECEVTFDVQMKVTRILESPRVTKPYTEEEWHRINALGTWVDERLKAADVRLTMGGEPTFVSIDDPDGPEWNVEALGKRKREIAGALLKRLRDRFAPGGLLFHGQGKWYPGESLPRWALGCHWRRDGKPIWTDDSLIADESKDYGHGMAEANRFAERLSSNLGLEPKWWMQAYEDAWYYSWRERRLPLNVDPLKSNLREREERERLAKVFLQGLGSAVGCVLPLRRGTDGTSWESGPWFLRAETLWLLPGDSPIGYRLPLDSLPWAKETDQPWVYPPDPASRWTELRAAIPPQQQRRTEDILKPASPLKTPARGPGSDPGPSKQPDRQESAHWVIRTAICVEPRNGRLHVFIPPVSTTEDCLDLVAAIELTAKQLGLPVLLEGTPPPHDPRLNVLKVTPDPGVIEVNLHAATSWDELASNTTILYEEARQCRLATEKFMLDGRHTGTGGGNHVVVGSSTPSDSPFLRRPHLLRSLVGYWLNHPSLSYLFSGLFIGPTSQHPRVDEARNDSIFELEIAFQQIPDHGDCPPWLVDRVFRHLLVDVTGNTHRTEFSIDKLYSPDSSSGRLGLVELRSFEMPPHSRMSLAQQLLLRGLIARFWDEPYRAKLVRWGTSLQDRFMLPHFVWEDFQDVLAEQRAAGFGFEDAWFAPHFEFRFPVIGEIASRGVALELRTALEPWHVLGEQPGGGGAVRYVDSSVERLQVKAQGLIDSRHAIACNGHRVPLHPTGRAGEFVSGIRYRAWQPPNCLHPTIPVHTPLAIEIIDTWNNRGIGSCTYHVMHPGGRNYATFPVNAYEAESRRLARFFPGGHTPGGLTLGPVLRSSEFPLTLDLRDPKP